MAENKPKLDPSPKERFQEDSRRTKAHLNLLERSDLQASLDAALMQYQHNLSKTSLGLNEAAACHFKISGAIEFLEVFRNLAGQYVPPVRKPEGQLLNV